MLHDVIIMIASKKPLSVVPNKLWSRDYDFPACEHIAASLKLMYPLVESKGGAFVFILPWIITK